MYKLWILPSIRRASRGSVSATTERSGAELSARSAPPEEPPVSGQRRVAPRASVAKRLARKNAALSSKASIARFVGGAVFIVDIRVYNNKPASRKRRWASRRTHWAPKE